MAVWWKHRAGIQETKVPHMTLPNVWQVPFPRSSPHPRLPHSHGEGSCLKTREILSARGKNTAARHKAQAHIS